MRRLAALGCLLLTLFLRLYRRNLHPQCRCEAGGQ